VGNLWLCLQDGEWEAVDSEPSLVLTDGSDVPLRGKGLYFLNQVPENKTMNLDLTEDGMILAGELAADPLQSLTDHLGHVFMASFQERGEWGKAPAQVAEEFPAQVKGMIDVLNEATAFREASLKLDPPDSVHDLEALQAQSVFKKTPTGRTKGPNFPAETIDHFQTLVGRWTAQVGKEVSSSAVTSEPTSGPMDLLDWWRERMHRLTAITDQFRSRAVSTVITVLSAALRSSSQEYVPESLPSTMREWKDSNMSVTEAANEAKDNVKYLFTLKTFIEPLYSGTPLTIIDSLPALLNSVKMIHSIARYFSTPEQMTDLFVRITNQMIQNCQTWILSLEEDDTRDDLWKKSPVPLVRRFQDCIDLNKAYQETYRIVKEKSEGGGRGKRFEFSEPAIFGRMDLFCRRCLKLAHLFRTISEFGEISTHKLEDYDEVETKFQRIVAEMRRKRHNLLSFSDNAFDRDFVEFNVNVNSVENAMQQYINKAFERPHTMEGSLGLLRKFRSVMSRPALEADLSDKLHIIFQSFGAELEQIQRMYEDYRHNPPKPRNLPPVAGNIGWARHLYRRIEEPMREFERDQAVLASKEAKRVIRSFNRVARTLVAFEYLWYQAWVESIESAKAGLQATLIIRHPDDGKLYVNFDAEILQLIREAKCLSRIGVDIPESARMVLLSEDKFKSYYNDLSFILKEYARISSKIIPVMRPHLQSALEDLEYRLRPGLVTLTWTSMNIDAYKEHVHDGLAKLEELISNVNDIIENRIEKNLKVVSKMLLVDLPDSSLTLDDFVDSQRQHTAVQSEGLQAKNIEVESAVRDLSALIAAHPLDPHIAPPDPAELIQITVHYDQYMYAALLNCVKASLNALKKRVASRSLTKTFFMFRPFFEIDAQLAVPNVCLVPSLDSVQGAINQAARLVLGCTKHLFDWGQAGPVESRTTFFDRITTDIEVVRVVLLLTGSIQGTRSQVAEYVASYKPFQWLWQKDADADYEEFMQQQPDIDDFDRRLQQLHHEEVLVEEVPPLVSLGALALKSGHIKVQLKAEVRRWMRRYTEHLHSMARGRLNQFTEYTKTTMTSLGRDVDSLVSLALVMEILREVRDRQSGIEGELSPIHDMYRMLERYGADISQSERDMLTVIRINWDKVIKRAEEVTDAIASLQVGFRSQLLSNVKEFKADVLRFRAEFDREGPMEEGITPSVAMERLKRFEDEFAMRERKREIYQNGELLFALPVTEYPEFDRTRKELALLGRLYGLFRDVNARMVEWERLLWDELRRKETIDAIQAEMDALNARCTKMPGKLRGWQAFKDLQKKIEDFLTVLPLITSLSKETIRPRHWDRVSEVTENELKPYDNPEFSLAALLAAPLVEKFNEIEEITDGADKEDKIEKKLEEVNARWRVRQFAFQPWKARPCEVLVGEKAVVDELDEDQMTIQTLLTSRHVKPFAEEAKASLKELSDAGDVLSQWSKVQQTWCALESVFLTGDIAKQMPVVSKKFQKVDKDFVMIMNAAKGGPLVTVACANEVLKSQLPVMNEELQICQNRLDSYLEKKRSAFPRFYFVSDPVLLQILSKGSDLDEIQKYYEKVFAGITRVTHDAKEKEKIIRVRNKLQGTWEELDLAVPVKATSQIEEWLDDLMIAMQRSLKLQCEEMAAEIGTMETKEQARDKLRTFVDVQNGQFSLLGIQFLWTMDVQRALERAQSARKDARKILKEAVSKTDDVLSLLSSWCLEDLGSKMNRTKIETLITIQVHQKDVIDELVEKKVSRPDDFEWLKQARFYWQADQGDSVSDDGRARIIVADVGFDYQYEYLGVKERLVITPLTDRCYITLSQAMGMFMGGAPAGPAGTGKTETVKDLGCTLGLFVVVTNCSDQMRYTDCAKIFKGLCQAGLWGCFDEFNRITLPVLSVVAQQVQSINDAKRANVKEFEFLGEPGVVLNPVCGYFITMNPGYAGRQELPENLKALFRGVAMMVPDREIIIKVKLCAVGYSGFKLLARKFFVCYTLCEQQLSKQRHYDFGLRNILSVLRTAGATKRMNRDAKEEMLLYRTLRDMNMSKLVAQDVPLFRSMLEDLFPSIKAPARQSFPDLEAAIGEVCAERGLVNHPTWRNKVIQLHETCLVRHGIMLVGPTGGGKTEIFSVLQAALSKVEGQAYKTQRLNPKAVAASELYGHADPRSGEWVKGVFAAIWEKYNNSDLDYITWIIEDGPVDTIWIEDLNTVLDDNRLLTLSNGDRFPMTDNTKIMFENETLKNASPATVSRAGIIFVSETELDWLPVSQAMIMQQEEGIRDKLRELFDRHIGECNPEEPGHLFRFLTRNCEEVMGLSRVGRVHSAMKLLTYMLSLHRSSMAEDTSSAEFNVQLEKLFVFSLAWTVGGMLEPADRLRLNEYLASKCKPGVLPKTFEEGQTIFELSIEPGTLKWVSWSPPEWVYPEDSNGLDFSNLLVPTMDSTRSLFLLKALHEQSVPVLLLGGPGTAKTSTALMFLATLDADKMLSKRINFSSATTQRMLQDSIEASLDKRGGRTYGPVNGKDMTVFIDDVSMPEINLWGDQPTNEMTRQIIEQGGLYFLDKDRRGEFKHFEGVRYVAAMTHPGGGRNDIPPRLKRQFCAFNLVLPAIKSIDDLYGQMLAGRFPSDEFSPSCISTVVNKLTQGTISLWDKVKAKMLPTPAKFHYIFNMRDLSRVFQGVLLTPKPTIISGGQQEPSDDQAFNLLRLWKHECARVFEDKLVSLGDKGWFQSTLGRVCEEVFGEELATKVSGEQIFVDFFRDDVYDDDEVLIEEAPKVYECGGVLDAVRQRVLEFMGKHNEANPSRQLNLVLFEDALRHLVRISRIIQMPRGSALLVGVGGSGKQSLTKLAAFIARHKLFQITLTKSYNVSSLLEDLKVVYDWAGHLRKPVTFLFTDAEIKSEDFLEYINSVLMTGDVAGLFAKDEMMAMTADLQPFFLKERPGLPETQDNLNQFFIENVRDNLHLVLCMSPVNPKFPVRARRFPGLISSTTIDWFLPWPEEALISVSQGLLGEFKIEADEAIKAQVVRHMGAVHSIVVETCDTYFASMRRKVYQTPKSFLSFIELYKTTYKKKLVETAKKEANVNLGLQKLIQGAEDVDKLKGVLAQEDIKVQKASLATKQLLESLKVDQEAADKKSQEVAAIRDKCVEEKERIEVESAACARDLAEAEPIVRRAEEAINMIKPSDIANIKALKKPADILRVVMDGVLTVLMRPLDSVKLAPAAIKDEEGNALEWEIVAPSWEQAIKLLADSRFLVSIQEFDRDGLSEETVEHISTIVDAPYFSANVAMKASGAAFGLATWVGAMKEYFFAVRIVKPKKEALAIAQSKLKTALQKLGEAEAQEREVQARVAELKANFDKQMAAKRALEDNAAALQNKLDQAEKLIKGLSGERIRWTKDSKSFAEQKQRLVGDCAVACAFVSYCGAFNSQYRELLMQTKFSGDLRARSIPVTSGLDPITFLVDQSTVGDWNIDGLPTDPLSIQNGILVTRSSRYPLLIDPQRQAFKWISAMQKRAGNLPPWEVTALNSPKLKDNLEFCMSEGRSMVVVGVEEDLDPLLDPILEKQIIWKGERAVVRIADNEVDLDWKHFTMYFLTRLPNPHFSPELQAKTTVVDFTVTMKGLEDQLLGIAIQREQRALEEQLEQVLAEVNSNRKSLTLLDQQLLEKLSGGSGNLLEEEGLIEMLADTKAKAAEVSEKLERAEETKQSIAEQREQYRPVAIRGSVLYFCVVEMSLVNVMYQTSLDQFVQLFHQAITAAPKHKLTNKRVESIIEEMTYIVYRYINKGLYERHKLLFVLIVTLKILVRDGKLEQSEVGMFLRGGAALDVNSVKRRPKWWKDEETWLNTIELSQSQSFFKTLPEAIERSDTAWRSWLDSNEPENTPIPDFEGPISDNTDVGPWLRLSLIRSLRKDRTLLAVRQFIKTVPFMGFRYVEPVTDTIDDIFATVDAKTPVLFLLSIGADPTESIQLLCKRMKNHVSCISMGEGQEPRAKNDMRAAAVGGSWVLLQNCELGLGLMDEMEDLLKGMAETVHPDFRLFITALPHEDFPLGLLQMSTKVTNDPPTGLQAGLNRSYTVIVSQDRLERIDAPSQAPLWRRLLYSMCFLHSIVQERRKFGPLGWCIPYEYNSGDLQACIMFLERHLYAGVISWPTVQYMVAEVQYGGKITDDLDRRLFSTYAKKWVSRDTVDDGFSFNPSSPINPIPRGFNYQVFDAMEIDAYRKFTASLPDVDSPELFGLHPNADLTFRAKEATELLQTLGETQPRGGGGGDAGAAGAKTKSLDEIVMELANELAMQVPEDYSEDTYLEQIRKKLGGMRKPMNVFLYQEVQRFQAVIERVRGMLKQMVLAIKGDVVMTRELQDAMVDLHEARVPKPWMLTATGDEFSWLFPGLGQWFNSFSVRDGQFRTWLEGNVPNAFWITGFFNPQGFLTAMKQQATRDNSKSNWALDDVEYSTEVLDFDKLEQVTAPPEHGVYMHGLLMDGAKWHKKRGTITESDPKVLIAELPVIWTTAVTYPKDSEGNLIRPASELAKYECPVYRYSARTGRYLVYCPRLETKDALSDHWILRGVAILCTRA
jgi:dynein heavy chain, axonemal